jgi:hypothetical protein
MMHFFVQKAGTMKRTREVAEGYASNAKAFLAYGAAIKEFSDTLWALFSVECQDALFSISPICELFERLSAANQSFGTAQLHVADDIRDISERYAILARTTSDHTSALRALADAKAKLQKCENDVLVASNRPDFNKGKADLSILRLRGKKKEALARARDRTTALIEEHQKFARFKFRRTQRAFVRLGTAIAEVGVSEARILTRLVEAIRKARSEEALTDATIEGIELVLRSGVVIATGPIAVAQILAWKAGAQGSEGQKEAVDQVAEERLGSEPDEVVPEAESIETESRSQPPEPRTLELVLGERASAAPTDEQFPESVDDPSAHGQISEPVADGQSLDPAASERPTEPVADKHPMEPAADDQVAQLPEEG